MQVASKVSVCPSPTDSTTLSYPPGIDYMNGFRCNITGATSTVPIATSRVPRRCGADPDFKKPDAAPWNCTYGAKQPFYWFQNEQNNVRPPSTHLFFIHCRPTDLLYDRCSKAHTPHRSISTFTGSTTAVRMTSSRTLRSRRSIRTASKQASRPGGKTRRHLL